MTANAVDRVTERAIRLEIEKRDGVGANCQRERTHQRALKKSAWQPSHVRVVPDAPYFSGDCYRGSLFLFITPQIFKLIATWRRSLTFQGGAVPVREAGPRLVGALEKVQQYCFGRVRLSHIIVEKDEFFHR